MINILIREFAPKQAVADQEAMEQFQKQWSTYQKLVGADALSHRATGNLLRDTLCAIPTTFAFVDIACGVWEFNKGEGGWGERNGMGNH
jgi:hypothetical protein